MTATNCVQFFFVSGGFRYRPQLKYFHGVGTGLLYKDSLCSIKKGYVDDV